MRDENNKIRIFIFANIRNQISCFFFFDSKLKPFCGTCNCRSQSSPGISQANHGNFQIANFPYNILIENRFLPFSVSQIISNYREISLINQIQKMIFRIQKIPISGRHDIVANGVHDFHHRNTFVKK